MRIGLGGIDWVLVKDYLSALVTWHVAVLVLGLVFMYKFTDSIREFLRKMDKFKAPGIEMTQVEARKSAFLQVYQVPSQVVDLIGERQAILNSLNEVQLIL